MPKGVYKPLTKIEAVARELCRMDGKNPLVVVEFKKRQWEHYKPQALRILRAIKDAERR